MFPVNEGVSVYAIIQAGGRQVKVAPGATVELDGRAAEAGKQVVFDQVLFLAGEGGELKAGAPFLSGAKVIGVVDGESRGPKVRVFKKKRRKGFRKQAGHRAFYTRVRITDIQG
jgi:large subunit ribosomal protein L21